MRYLKPPVVFALILPLLLASCGDSPAPEASLETTAPYIVTVNAPLFYFAQRLAGEDADIRLPAAPDTDPAQWRPSMQQALELQGAELVLLNGAGYSSWPDKVAVSSNRLVVTGEAFRDNWIELIGEVTHSHGPEGDHAHAGYAFTTWMDMRLAQRQAEAVAQALATRNPADADRIHSILATLLSELENLHAAYKAQASRLQGRQIIYSHPVYQYFERAYSLPGISLHWEPDVMPSDEQWLELQKVATSNALFVWEGDPDPEIAGRMQAMGIAFVVIDPAANIAQNNWLAIQQANVARLEDTATGAIRNLSLAN